MAEPAREVGDAATAEAPLALGEFLPYRFSVVAEAISRLFASRYERSFGLTIPEWRVMAVLGEAAPRSTQQVIEQTGMDRVRVSRAVIRLADKGLIERRPQPGDNRAQLLQLSRRGQATYRQIVPLAHTLQAALATALSPAEQRQLDTILLKLGRRAATLAAAGEPDG
ncbi:MarR family winged helix-turn-helix transcriptional regulator [Roseomonas sp. BN140053]|uniref:MarR family winged helix-turn-helix transcriptional regulator n=1 Tax=Roseomonas sp. BN140053 TaxID=3391898 RepID=UPI0039EC6C53